MADRPQYQKLLPWSSLPGERSRFTLILVLIGVFFLPPAVLIPIMDVPEQDRQEAEKIPPRLARLVEQRKPPEPVQVPEPEAQPEPEPEAEPEPEPEVADPEPQPEPEPRAQPRQREIEQAREKASRSGLLAMKDRLAQMRQTAMPEPESKVRANVSRDGQADLDNTRIDRNRVLAGSGGIEEGRGPVRDVELEDYQVASVEEAPEPELAPIEQEVAMASVPDEPGERGMDNIRKVFDGQKTALYSLYRRELRQDPTLEGKVLLELVIEPDGSVSSCEVVSSELDNPELEARLATRVRLFNFGARDVKSRTVRFPIDFLPG